MIATTVGEATDGVRTTGARFYRPELDCLRFFAFFAVFVYHSPGGDLAYYTARHVPFPALVASVISAGRFGVDLFFLLSAYLITELLLRERDRFGKVDLRFFYARRILRIWPLYFLGLLIGYAVAAANPAEQYFPLKYVAAFVFMAGNWIFLFGAKIQSVMIALWSVSFEEQFYLLWPAFISRVRTGKALLWASGVLVLVAMISRLALQGHARAMGSEVPIFTNSLARLDPLAVGIATAVVFHNTNPTAAWKWTTRLGVFGTGCAVLLAAGRFYGLSTGFLLIGYPAVAAGAWLIFCSFLGAHFTPPWLRYLGKISYGLYVFHELALFCCLRLMGGSVHSFKSFIVYWCLGLSLTVVIAALSYHLFESRFLALKERFARVQSRPV